MHALGGCIDRVYCAALCALSTSNAEQVVKAYMKEDRVFIDLVKEGSVKASKDVEHIGIPCHWTRCDGWCGVVWCGAMTG